jgi:hypothetical protein
MLVIAATPLAAVACRSSNPGSGSPDAPGSIADAPPGTADAPPGTPDGAMATGCNNTYSTSTIAAMRQGNVNGCFELDNVVTLDVTPSTKSPRLFVQDAAGGMYSGMMTRCSSMSTSHPCTVAATVAALAKGRSVTVKGTYIKSKNTGFEEFFIDDVTDNGAATPPAAATATVAEISRGGTNPGLAFQRVTVTLAPNDPLVMYDWTPSELANATATKCPYVFGFGMIPKSAKATATAACTSGTAQPTGQAAPASAEVLIGTDFFKTYTISSDCRCAKTFTDMVPSAQSQLTGSISGILVFDVPFGGSGGYYYLAPEANADAPLTATVPGM